MSEVPLYNDILSADIATGCSVEISLEAQWWIDDINY